MSEEVFDVIVVGYGPTGATLANLLGQAGHRVAIADSFADVFEQPRAINIDQEVLRTWQRIGLADEIAADCQPHTGTDFLGADGGLIKYLYSAPPPHPLGWPANIMFVQPEAERALRRGVRRFSNVTEYLAHEMTSVRQDDDGVTVTLKAADGVKTIRGRWLVGCDGANSPVRQHLGIGQEDLGFSEWWVVVDAWLRHETALPTRTTQYCLPEAPGAYVVCSSELRRWEMKVLPDESPESYRDQDKVRQRLATYVDPDAVELWRSAAYHFHARVTDRWRMGRIFLAGDAAHQMPPFLGQGLCSGIRDASNLSWKLDRVLREQSPESFLDTYELERKPHIRVLTEITKSIGKIVGETDPQRAAARDQTLREEMRSGRMETVRQNLIPPLTSGFIDTDGTSILAGAVGVQPLLEVDGRGILSDDIGSTGMQLLTTQAIDPELITSLRQQGVEVLLIGPDALRDIEGTFAAFCERHALESIFVRPDGYIWGGQGSAEATEAAARRLLESLHVAEISS